MLILSIDEREDGDVEGCSGQVPFVINEDLAEQYGLNYVVSLDENKTPAVAAQA